MAVPGQAFAFVTVDSAGKLSAEDQRTVRTRSTRGISKRRRQQKPYNTRSGTIPLAARQHIFEFKVESTPPSPSVIPRSTQLVATGAAVADNGRHPSLSVHSSRVFRMPEPPRHSAVELDLESSSLLIKVLPTVMGSFSLQRLLLSRDLTPSPWNEWLDVDVACIHAMVLACHSIHDSLLQAPPSRLASLHFVGATDCLNSRLSDEALLFQDSTVGALISLVLASCISRHYAVAAAHAAGLSHILRLRGGLQSFSDSPHLIVGMARVDLCLSLGSGHAPFLNMIPSLRKRGEDIDVPRFFTGTPFALSRTARIDDLADVRLARTFRQLQDLACRINNGTSGGQRVSELDLHQGLMSAQYQLFQLEGLLGCVIDECLRMTMLGFLTSSFTVVGSRISYKYAADRLREQCLAIEISQPQLLEPMFWILVMSGLSFFDWDEPWLCQRLRVDLWPLTHNLEWSGARSLLRKFIWVDECHEVPGKRLFERILGPTHLHGS